MSKCIMPKIIENILEKELFVLKSEKVKKYLEQNGIQINKLNAIEIFGGKGLNDSIFAKNTNTFDVWEIEKGLEEELKTNLPNAKIIICDSIKVLKKENGFKKYDLILIDNPIGVFGKTLEYCEHFDLIKNIDKLIEKQSVIVFLVNKKPFFLNKLTEKNELWRKRRREFYGNVDIENISTEFLLEFYTEIFRNMGFDIIFSKNIPRHTPHLDYLIFNLKRNSTKHEQKIKHVDWISLSGLLKNN